MRFMMTICSALLLFSSVFAQEKVDGQGEYTAEFIELVKTDVEQRALGFSLSVIGKRIPRLGDGVSIALLKIYDIDALESPENIRNYLPSMRAAFTAPKLIRLSENKKPEVTIFLLTYLESRVEDENLKAQISGIIKFVKKQTLSENVFNVDKSK